MGVLIIKPCNRGPFSNLKYLLPAYLHNDKLWASSFCLLGHHISANKEDIFHTACYDASTFVHLLHSLSTKLTPKQAFLCDRFERFVLCKYRLGKYKQRLHPDFTLERERDTTWLD
jgi:hypothetical protein